MTLKKKKKKTLTDIPGWEFQVVQERGGNSKHSQTASIHRALASSGEGP